MKLKTTNAAICEGKCFEQTDVKEKKKRKNMEACATVDGEIRRSIMYKRKKNE